MKSLIQSALIFPIIASILPALSICPNKLQEAVKHCLAGYDSYSQNMIGHPTSLMYGTDVEVIRMLCSHYKHSMLCVDFLKTDCKSDPPATREIDRLTVNVLYLKDMCMKSDFYEMYAMNQHCFKRVDKQSAQCYRQFEKQTETMLPGALAGIEAAAKSTCQYYDRLTNCIKNVLERSGCGVRAPDLVDYLVRPAVRVGKVCKMLKLALTTTPAPKATRPPRQRSRRPYQPRKKDSYKFKMEAPSERNISAHTSSLTHLVLVSSIYSLLLLLLYH